MLSRTARQFACGAISSLGLVAGAMVLPMTAHAQDDDLTAQYRATLDHAANVRSNLTQRQFYVQEQADTIAALEAAIEDAEATQARETLLPMVRTMVAELEKVMVADLPFRVERRFALLDDLREDLQSDDVAIGDAYRRAMELYSLEVEMGLQVGSYLGNNPVDPGGRYAACVEDPQSSRCDLSKEQTSALNNGAEIEDLREQLPDGNFVHFGRLTLMYLERDSSVGYRYNEETKAWDRVSNSELLGLRQNVRIARGDSAISTMVAPIRITSDASDAS